MSGNLTSILDYGTNTGTGGDDSAAFTAALAWLNAGPNRALFIPPASSGAYNYDQAANGALQMNQVGASVYGVGNASKITFSGGGANDGFRTNNDFQTISDLMLYTTTKAGGYLINYIGGGNPRFRNLTLWEAGSGNALGLTNTVNQLYCFMESLRIITHGSSAIGLDIQTVTSLLVGNDITILGNSMTDTSIGLRGPLNVSQDTFILSNSAINNYQTCVFMSPNASGAISDWHWNNVIVDQSYYALYYGSPAGGGVCNRNKFTNCWFASGGDAGCVALFWNSRGGAYNQTFSSCRFYALNSGNAIYWQSGTAQSTGWQFSDCIIELSGWGMNISSDAQIDVIGCTFQSNVLNDVLFGIIADFSTATLRNFQSCSFRSTGITNVAFQTSGAGSGYGNLAVIANCVGYNPVGPLSAPPVPASTVVLANPFPFDCLVYVKAATGGATIHLRGTSLGAIAGGSVMSVPLKAGSPGESIAITYTNAPTWVWIGA